MVNCKKKENTFVGSQMFREQIEPRARSCSRSVRTRYKLCGSRVGWTCDYSAKIGFAFRSMVLRGAPAKSPGEILNQVRKHIRQQRSGCSAWCLLPCSPIMLPIPGTSFMDASRGKTSRLLPCNGVEPEYQELSGASETCRINDLLLLLARYCRSSGRAIDVRPFR